METLNQKTVGAKNSTTAVATLQSSFVGLPSKSGQQVRFSQAESLTVRGKVDNYLEGTNFCSRQDKVDYAERIDVDDKERLVKAIRTVLLTRIAKLFGLVRFQGQKITKTRIEVDGSEQKIELPEVNEGETMADYLTRNNDLLCRVVLHHQKQLSALAEVRKIVVEAINVEAYEAAEAAKQAK